MFFLGVELARIFWLLLLCHIYRCKRADAVETFSFVRRGETRRLSVSRCARIELRRLLFSVVAPPCTGWRGSAVVGYAGTSCCYCDRAAHEQRWPLDRPILKIGIALANYCKTANVNIPCLNHDVEGRGGLNPANSTRRRRSQPEHDEPIPLPSGSARSIFSEVATHYPAGNNLAQPTDFVARLVLLRIVKVPALSDTLGRNTDVFCASKQCARQPFCCVAPDRKEVVEAQLAHGAESKPPLPTGRKAGHLFPPSAKP